MKRFRRSSCKRSCSNEPRDTLESHACKMRERTGGRSEIRNSRSPASASNDRSRRVTLRSGSFTPEEWKNCLFRGAQHLLRSLRCPLLVFLQRMGEPLFSHRTNNSTSRMREHYNCTNAGTWNTFSRLLRLGLLLFGGVAGFAYAAYSGQMPLLLPVCQRREAAADGHSLRAAFSPSPSYLQSASPHTPGKPDAASGYAECGASLPVPRGGAGGTGERSRPPEAQRRKAEQQEREPQVRAPQEKRQQLQGLPQQRQNCGQQKREQKLERDQQEHRQQEHGQREFQKMQQFGCRPLTNSEAGRLTEDSSTSLDSSAPASSESVTSGNRPSSCCVAGASFAGADVAVADGWDAGDKEEDFASGELRGEEKVFPVDHFSTLFPSFFAVLAAAGRAAAVVFSQWNAATSLWLLLLVFHLIPPQERWPLQAQRGGPPGGSKQLASRRRSNAVTETLPKAHATEKANHTQELLDFVQPQAPSQGLQAHTRNHASPQEQHQQQTKQWSVVSWCKAWKTSRFWRSIVERGELVEVFLQCVELTVVGFFLSFFFAKTLFGCESILRQMEAHFVVLLLFAHLLEYLFYFWVHPDELSVDRFIFNNHIVYTLAVALSLLELLLKPYELAAGATLGHIVHQARPLLHTQQAQQQSGNAFSLVRTHQQLLSKQQDLLHLLPVNVLMLELSWVAHFVQAAGRLFDNNSRHGSKSYNSGGNGGDSEQIRNDDEQDLTVAGRNPSAWARATPYPASHLQVTRAAATEAEPKAATRDSSCCCSWYAAYDHWRRGCCEEAKKESGVVYSGQDRSSSSLMPCRADRYSACCNVFNSSRDPTENSEDGSTAGVTQSNSKDDAQQAVAVSGRSSSSRDTDGNSTRGSCWELSFLLSCWMLGALFAIGGLTLRALAHFTARRNFTHKIACASVHERQLVTHGIYAFLRHPGYAGYFYWAVGLQLMVCNVSLLLFTLYALRIFFFHRIVFEERMLERIFPDGAYASYRAATPATGVPFIAHRVRHLREAMVAATKAPAEDGGAQSLKRTT